MIYNILDYGAVGDGKTLNTDSIQKAINDCTLGGGEVIIPAGRFVTGSLELKSNVELHLEKGAILIASTDLADYNAEDAYSQNWGCASEGWDGKHLIWCVERENASISGSGTIDGSGSFFFDDSPQFIYKGYGWRFGVAKQKPCFDMRPGQTIVFCECQNVSVRGIKIINSTSWALYFHGCEDVQVSGITVKNKNYHLNTDGIDIDACKNTTISDCIIDTGDDAITFRCSSLRLLKKDHSVCEHVTVSNCVLSSASSCFRIGVGTGTIRHIKVSNITVKCSGAAINFNPEWADNSTPTYDVAFNNITAINTGVFFHAVSRRTRVSEISVSNAYSECDSAFFVESGSEECIRNINFSEIFIKPEKLDVEIKMPFSSFQNTAGIEMNNVKTDNAEVISPLG